MGEARRRTSLGLPPKQRKTDPQGQRANRCLAAINPEPIPAIRCPHNKGGLDWDRRTRGSLDRGAFYWTSSRLVGTVRHAVTLLPKAAQPEAAQPETDQNLLDC